MLQEEDVDDECAALGRMLASHHENMQDQSRPLNDDTEVPITGTQPMS